MASQTVILSSSFTPKLATFNSRTLLPLPPPLRTFSCSSSIPMPCLKASYGGIWALKTSNFKCYAAPGASKLLSRSLSQTVTLSSSIPQLATFNSRALLPLSPSPTFGCSSALPVPCLKASYGGIRTIRIVNSNNNAAPGTRQEIKDLEQVQSLGKFAVEEHNKKEKTDIKFISVVKAEKQEAEFKYHLRIEGEVNKNKEVFEAVVFAGHSDRPNRLNSFAPSCVGK